MRKVSFQVIISAPDRVVFEGEATTLESANSEGSFMIMPDHARFMTLVSGEPISITLVSGEQTEFTFSQAVLLFEGDMAKVYVHDDVLPYMTPRTD